MEDKKFILRNRFIKKRFIVKKRTAYKAPANYDSTSAVQKTAEETLKSKSDTKETKALFDENNADKAERRAKRAAYLKAHAESDISASYSETIDENEEAPSDDAQSPVGTDITDEVSETDKFERIFFGNTDYAKGNVYASSLENEDVREKYKAELAKRMTDKRKAAFRDNIVKGAELASGYVGAMKSGDAVGMITQPVVGIIRENLQTADMLDNVSKVSGTVQNSDSVGGAVADVGVNLATEKMKSAVYEGVFKPPDERVRERMEKKYYHIDRDTDKKVQRSQEQYKKKLAKQQAEAQRKQQKKIFIKRNKNNPAFVGNTVKEKAIKSAAKSKILLLGAGSSFLLVVIIIIILLMIIASLFSWMDTYEYSLAGDESNDPMITADNEKEILEGYTLMIQNFMDVTQAYFYLDYGDWYGGVYDYPAPESFLSFSDYFTELQRTIIDEIQASYAPLFAEATSPEQAMAISQAMSREITAALEAAAVYAREDYLMLMESLDDCMKPEEHRQHYEIHNAGGGSGERDSYEFTGKPIIGTNHFDDVEFNSELSAEELLSMVALYKSFLSMDKPDEEVEGEGTEDTEETFVYAITPQNIMDFFEETEYVTVTTEITENNSCDGNCKRILEGDLKSGYYWTYYCDSDHLNLTGVVNPCKTKDELICKIMELTGAEEKGIDKEDCEEMVEAYIEVIQKELDISEADYRQSGKADNERAKAFYEMLIDPSRGAIPNNYWTVNTEFSE